MNDINKMTLRERELQSFLLEWLIKHGHESVYRHYIWNLGDWKLAESCMKQGYLDTTKDGNSNRFMHALTEKGLEFLNGHQ